MPFREVEILLVEDNPDDEFLVLRALRKHNVSNRVHVVRDGEEALDFLFSRGPYENEDSRDTLKLILLDVKLPKLSGLEVLAEIKQHPGTRHLPVVLLTSSRLQEEMLRAYVDGELIEVANPPKLNRRQNHSISVVVDRLVVRGEDRARAARP